MSYNDNITRQQKESIFLLSIGTFLEYFDLMLYVHMAVLLNDLFFPQSDPTTAKLLAALTFCSTFMLRPVGGFVIGMIGDKIGRKNTIIITTSIMAVCCITMATIGTYAEIGIAASIVMVACRALQGFSSMGEKVGAQLYLAETLKQPYRYMYGGMITVQSQLGGFFALIIAYFAISSAFNWRIVFWIGAIIALVGLVARTRLRETPEYVDFKRRLKIKMAIINKPELLKNFSPSYKEKLDIRALLAYFFVCVTGTACVYITYIYMGSFMREHLGLNAEGVISQNTKISIVTIICMLLTVYSTKKYHPLKMAKLYIAVFSLCLLFVPYCLNHITNLFLVFCFQFVVFIPLICIPGVEITCFQYIPVGKRYTILATTFGIAAALVFIIVSFGLVSLEEHFGSYGLWFIQVPMVIGLIYGITYLEKLEKKNGRYDYYPDEGSIAQSDLESLEETVIDYNFKNPEEYKAHSAQCEYAQGLLNKLRIINQQGKNDVNIRLVEKAIIFAKKWHDGQFRKTGEPYYTHPLAVADIVAEFLPKTDVIVAAILHDVLEDSKCPLELIASEFNERIAQMVYRLTRIRSDENGNEIKLTIEELIDGLKKDDDKEALLIKEVDRLHNLSTIEGLSKEKQDDNANETMKNIVTNVAYTVDDLNINDKLSLENDLLKNCETILKKDDRP